MKVVSFCTSYFFVNLYTANVVGSSSVVNTLPSIDTGVSCGTMAKGCSSVLSLSKSSERSLIQRPSDSTSCFFNPSKFKEIGCIVAEVLATFTISHSYPYRKQHWQRVRSVLRLPLHFSCSW